MGAARLSENEAARIAAVREYDILDSGSEEAFDALTTLVARALDVPISMISIIDEKRQWLKSRYGLDLEETPRDVSFCSHVVSEEQPIVAPDLSADPRFADNPFVTAADGVRFYAGYPLKTPAGFVLGTICAVDTVPRELTANQKTTLQLLADQVISLLELRRKTRLLEERDLQLRAVFDGMVEGVHVVDSDGRVIDCNAAAADFLRMRVDELIGTPLLENPYHVIREDGTRLTVDEMHIAISLRTGKAFKDVIVGVQVKGDFRWISVSTSPLRRGDGTTYSVVTTFRDITTQRATDAALTRRERLVTTGTLAAGVGHEINNPLSYIMANTDYALEELRALEHEAPSQRTRELIDVLGETKEGAQRVHRIVRGLRSLAREEAELAPTDLAAVVDMSISMAMHELRQIATVTTAIARVPRVTAEEGKLTQVLVNLLVNAAQCFTSRNPITNLVRVAVDRATDGRVCVAIADNGPGIPNDVLARIFDPFFTTKPIGLGTGLGLSISSGIITNFGGELTCETEVGRGTTFRVLLPIA